MPPHPRPSVPVSLRTTDLFVLAVLTAGPQHGYALSQAIAERSGGRVQVRPGDLYRVLYRMEAAGLIEVVPARSRPSGDERRTHYRITPLGRRTARDQAAMLADVCGALLDRPARETLS
jgi:DNA-binding PadR family transcriptional regulator